MADDEENPVCPLCTDELSGKRTLVIMNCCSGQVIHAECYAKCLPRCPFCRAQQSKDIFKVEVIEVNWRRIALCLCWCVVAAACASITIISAQCAESQP